MPEDQPANIVDKSFWEEEYFGGESLPSRPDPTMAFERCLMAGLEQHAAVTNGASVIEAGCAPAKWLAFYAERFGARVSGIEYSAQGAALSRENLRLCGVDDAEIVEGDFFEVPPSPHDLVLSLGFIEHFDDLEGAFARHVEFLAPGGRLVIGVPNYRGANALVQRWADPEHLALHNTDAMRPSWLREVGARSGLTVEHVGYLGGFDPIIIKVTRRSALLWTIPEGRWRRLAVADRVNHGLLSSYLLAVYRRPV